jgi:hypothetical protein
MLTVNNLSVQFGKEFDEVNTTFHMVIFMELLVQMVLENLLSKIISGEMDPTIRSYPFRARKTYVGFKPKPHMFDEHTVLETVIMGNKVLYSVKKEMDELYL